MAQREYNKKIKNKKTNRNVSPDKSLELCYDKCRHIETKLLRGLQNLKANISIHMRSNDTSKSLQ